MGEGIDEVWLVNMQKLIFVSFTDKTAHVLPPELLEISYLACIFTQSDETLSNDTKVNDVDCDWYSKNYCFELCYR